MSKSDKKKVKKVKETKETKEEFIIENTDQLLQLMSIYLEEFNQRNVMLWKQVFLYYFSILIVMILPFASPMEIDFDNKILNWLFPTTGLILSIPFLIVSMGYAVRLSRASEIYNKLIGKLEKDFQRRSIKEGNSSYANKIISLNMTKFICVVMFITLVVIGIILIRISVQ